MGGGKRVVVLGDDNLKLHLFENVLKKSSTWRLQLGGSPCKSLCPNDVVAKSFKKGTYNPYQ